jgi:hypothetical protein
VISACTPNELKFFCKQVEYFPQTDLKGIKLVDQKGLLAITAYDGWTENSVKIHVWIRDGGAISRKFIKESFRYPFEIAKKGLVIGITPGYNHASLEFNRRVGFREVYRIPDGWASGTDLVIQLMRRDQCRWLTRGSNGQEEHPRGS